MNDTKERVDTSPPAKRNCLKWSLLRAGVAVLIIVGAAVALIPKSSEDSTSSENSQNTNLVGLQLCASESTDSNLGGDRRLQTDSYQTIGCFQAETSLDFLPLVDTSLSGAAAQCSEHCVTKFFGVTGDDVCYCFIDSPADRLALGSCASLGPCDVSSDNRMEVYFDPKYKSECNQELTSSVRNFLVEEDDSPFGFDLVSNTFMQSPFELYKDECGTNIYEVQTEVSSFFWAHNTGPI